MKVTFNHILLSLPPPPSPQMDFLDPSLKQAYSINDLVGCINVIIQKCVCVCVCVCVILF